VSATPLSSPNSQIFPFQSFWYHLHQKERSWFQEKRPLVNLHAKKIRLACSPDPLIGSYKVLNLDWWLVSFMLTSCQLHCWVLLLSGKQKCDPIWDETHHWTLWRKHPLHVRLYWHCDSNLDKWIYGTSLVSNGGFCQIGSQMWICLNLFVWITVQYRGIDTMQKSCPMKRDSSITHRLSR